MHCDEGVVEEYKNHLAGTTPRSIMEHTIYAPTEATAKCLAKAFQWERNGMANTQQQPQPEVLEETVLHPEEAENDGVR